MSGADASPEKRRAAWQNHAIQILLIVAITALAYWSVVSYPFLNYDDDVYVTRNPHVQNGLTLDGIRWAFTATHAGNWHPLTWLSHMLDCQLFGLNAGAHHCTSLILHLINVVLLYLVMNSLTSRGASRNLPAMAVAALFALHPVQAESVAWVAERKNMLSGLFWFLTVLTYLRYARRPTVWRMALVTLVVALGLMAKPVLVTLPFILLLLDYWPLQRFAPIAGSPDRTWPLMLEKTPLFALAALSCAITFQAQQSSGAVMPFESLPLGARLANALVSYAAYIVSLFWPVGLAPLYPYTTWPLPTVIGATLGVAAVSALVAALPSRRYLLVGWLWFLGSLVPMLGLVQVGIQARADRYLYVSSVGIFIMLVWGLSEIAGKWRRARLILAPIAVVAVGMLGFATKTVVVHYWRDSETLFRHTIAVTRDNWVAQNNLGVALIERGEAKEAIEHFREAIRIEPRSYLPHYGLAGVLETEGATEEAIASYTQAIALNPEHVPSHCQLGQLLLAAGQLDAAIEHYKAALALSPSNVQARTNLGIALARQGDTDAAITWFTLALQVEPDCAAAHYNLAVALMLKNNRKEAASHFAEAVRLLPPDDPSRQAAEQALRTMGEIL